MNALTIGILGSLIATIIWQLLGLIFNKIKTPLDLLSSFMGKEWCRKYKDFNDAKKYIWFGVKNSKRIKYFSVRGFPLTQETYELRKAILNCDCFNPRRNVEFKVMINDPDKNEAQARAQEYYDITREPADTYLAQIKLSFNSLIDLKDTTISNLKIKLHNNPALFRILIFDEFCLVGFYTKEIIGLNSPTIVFKEKTIFYQIFERYFDQTWEKSEEKMEKFSIPISPQC